MPVTNSKTTLTNTTHTADGTYYTTSTGTVFNPEPYAVDYYTITPYPWDNTIYIGSVDVPMEDWEKALKKILDKSKTKPNPRPKDPIDRVFFNYKKRTTTIIWKDKTVTTVKCAEDEEFDEEKGIAICFMKKFFDNRGCFNEFLKKYLKESIVQ